MAHLQGKYKGKVVFFSATQTDLWSDKPVEICIDSVTESIDMMTLLPSQIGDIEDERMGTVEVELSHQEVQDKYPAAWDAIPESYKNKGLTFHRVTVRNLVPYLRCYVDNGGRFPEVCKWSRHNKWEE